RSFSAPRRDAPETLRLRVRRKITAGLSARPAALGDRPITALLFPADPVGRLCDHCSMFGRSGSIKLATLFGFRIGVDRSWFLVLFLMIFWLSGAFRNALHS